MKMPDPRAYRRLAALLRDQITSGILAPGAQLPPIGALCHQHGHSRQDEGVICRLPGLGYFVADKDE